MSSPHSNLRKTRKSPLPNASSPSPKAGVPFRHPVVDDNGLLNEVTSRMAKESSSSPLRQTRPIGKIRQPVSTKHDAPTDVDLMQTMMSRIAILEKKILLQAKDINDKDKTISIKEEKIRLLQIARDEGGTGSSQTVKELERKCAHLQKSISEIEAFLADYGMIWVGQEEEGDIDDLLEGESADLWNPGQSVVGDGPSVDYDRILKCIEDLNVLANEGCAQIERTTDGARFKIPDPVRLILYANGLLMFDGPFRPFEDISTQTCVRDLEDGYFPSELQTRYPEGVPIKVIDKRTVVFEQRQSKAFQGSGVALGGDHKLSRLVPTNLDKCLPDKSSKASPTPPNNTASTRIQGLTTESELPGVKLTMDQFLTKLPASVIKQGRVIDIRSSLRDKVGHIEGSKGSVVVVETDVMTGLKERLSIDENSRPPSGKNITTLRIKSEKGDGVYLLKMRFRDTIGQVKEYINSHRKGASTDYSLVSAFPSKVYDDPKMTLFSAGLTPNATLHIRAHHK